MRIRAAIFHGPNTPFSIETLDLAEPKEGEALVQIKATGVCHSDWHLMTGATKHPVPCVPGHEGAGIVVAFGSSRGGAAGPTSSSSLAVGDTVALSWAPSCGECFYCGIGRPALCGAYAEPIWAGTMMDGTTRLSWNGKPVYHFSALACFAEYAVVPVQCCVPLPSDTPFAVAALIGCAVTTGVGAVVNTARIPGGASVVVYGVGGVGLSAIMGAKAVGAEAIIAVDAISSKLEMARSLGATQVVKSGANAVAEIVSLTGGRSADYAIECTGIAAVQEQALEAIRPGGALILAGIAPMGSGTNFPGAILTRQEKTVMGGYYGTADPEKDFPLYANWYRQGRLPLDRLISHRYRLDQINEAYADLIAGKNARGVVVFD